MSKKQFSQEQKLKILESAEKLGARPVADIAGIHYITVYEWRNQLKAKGKKAFVEHQPAILGRGIKQPGIDCHILNFTRLEGEGCIVIRRRPITQ